MISVSSSAWSAKFANNEGDVMSRQLRHSELTAKLAIEGAVAAIGGTVKGQIGIQPRVLDARQKAELGMSDIGDTLFYPIDDGGVFFHTDGAFTTIWYANGDFEKGVGALDALLKRAHPDAKQVKDETHETDPDLNLRTYDIRLPNNHLAIVDAIYPKARAAKPKFMVRVTAMARQN